MLSLLAYILTILLFFVLSFVFFRLRRYIEHLTEVFHHVSEHLKIRQKYS